ncbi:MAG: adenylate/guanylate cyclase domain-containing protein [Parcubacteria group bacterium]|nr:adenylate/guanylate cyclase domain-containing protein [Parcubacteria group bacterium]
MPKRYLIILLQALLVGGFVSLLFIGSIFSGWQKRLMDQFYIGYPPSDKIAIVAIDDNSLQQTGRWPWDRSKIAKLVEIIALGGAKSIGVDIAFPEPQSETEDTILAQTLQKYPIVTLPLEATLAVGSAADNTLISKKILYPIPQFRKAAFSLGLANMPPDSDGIVRKQPILARGEQGVFHEAFIIKVLRKYFDLPDTRTNEARFPRSYYFWHYAIPLDGLGRFYLNFAGKPNTIQTYPAYKLFNKEISPAIFKNKIVLIGVTAPDLHDEQLVPTSKGNPMPGVEIHANAGETILSQRFLFDQSRANALAVIIFTALLGAVIFNQFKPLAASILLMALTAAYTVLAALLFDIGLIFQLFYALLTIIGCYLFALLYHYFYARSRKKFIQEVFQHYVAAPIVKDILKHPEHIQLGGEKRIVTILLSDIRGFTTIAEKLDTEILVKYLNEYFTTMSDIILKNRGLIDKYIGDSIMAFWNAPLNISGHEKLAVKTALEMIKTLPKINKQFAQKGYPPLDIGIGIHTGQVIVGNIGSKTRFDYTLIGDAVNLASRVEGLNKYYHTQILITQPVFAKVSPHFPIRYLDLAQVKGRTEPMRLYEVGKEPFNEPMLKQFSTGIKFYQAKHFKEALQLFRELSAQWKEDTVIPMYIARCEEFIKNPPPKEWKGVYEWKEK